jgi:hypothetical protein
VTNLFHHALVRLGDPICILKFSDRGVCGSLANCVEKFDRGSISISSPLDVRSDALPFYFPLFKHLQGFRGGCQIYLHYSRGGGSLHLLVGED